MINGIMNYWATFIIWALITTDIPGSSYRIGERYFQKRSIPFESILRMIIAPPNEVIRMRSSLLAAQLHFILHYNVFMGYSNQSNVLIKSDYRSWRILCGWITHYRVLLWHNGDKVRGLQIGFMLQPWVYSVFVYFP